MNFLFIHQNFPGQFRHIAPALATPQNRVVCLGDVRNVRQTEGAPFEYHTYGTPNGAGQQTHHYVRHLEGHVRRAQNVIRSLVELKQSGFVPDLIFGHHGWGEMLFVRDVFPRTKIMSYLEFYYNSEGADVGFDPEFPNSFDDQFRVRTKNATTLLTLDGIDWGMSPTKWQQSQFPAVYRNSIDVIHDGIKTDELVADPDAVLEFEKDGKAVHLTREDEVVTYVARNLEPYRGFHSYMRALPEMQKRRPKAHFVIVGGDEVSYGRWPKEGTYRQQYMKEVGDKLDMSRVHFLGRIDYGKFCSMLRVSRVHIYLTYPFVMSWSLLESMSQECAIVGSDTKPVQEAIDHGVHGNLVDFFSPEAIAESVSKLLDDKDARKAMGEAARKRVIERYDLTRVCLPAQVKLIEDVLNGRKTMK